MNKKLKSIVVVVTWNRIDLLKQLLEALKKQEDKSFGLIVVDNGSEDGSRELLAKEELESTTGEIPIWGLFLKENLGFALPNNLGITFATELSESNYIILLNNDTIPDPNFIKLFHEKADSYLDGSDQKNLDIYKRLFPFLSQKNGWKIGSFAPLVENYYARGKVDAAGIRISPDGNAINRGVGEKTFKFQREKEVFGPSGSAVLYPKKALLDVALPPINTAILKERQDSSSKKEGGWSVEISHKLVGKEKFRKSKPVRNSSLVASHRYLPIKEFFSSRYFAYFEDVDLAWRLRLRLWGSVYVPQVKILHYHSATAKAYSPLKSFYVHRNQYFNIVRDFPSFYVFVGLWNAFKRYFYLLQSLKRKRGPAARVAKNSSSATVFYITIKGWGSVIRNIVGLIRERFYIQKNRLISRAEFRDVINCPRFRASFEKMIFETQDFLEEQKKIGVKDKGRVS